MKPAVIVLLVVSQGDLAEPAMIALRRAAERALGADSRIVVHEQTAPLSDDDTIGLAEQMRASVVVEISWPAADRTSAHVHVHFAQRPGWLDRDLAFAPNEPITERGRTLGFEIATMVPDAPPAEAGAEPRPSSDAPEHPALPVPSPAGSSPWAADVSIAGSVGVRGNATGLGLAVGGQWISARGVYARLGASGRFGSIDAPGMSASSTNLSVGPGVGFLVGWPASPLRAGAHADGLLVYTQVARSASTPPAETKSRFLPGAALMLDGELSVSPPVFLTAGLGLEFAFGTTDVRLGQDVVASIPRVRALGELGFRYRF